LVSFQIYCVLLSIFLHLLINPSLRVRWSSWQNVLLLNIHLNCSILRKTSLRLGELNLHFMRLGMWKKKVLRNSSPF
jgi:hypothetical protein